MQTLASAPGKLVLLGEYAVLEGAPALVLAVNRRARVTLTPAAGAAWEIVSPTLALSARLISRSGALAWEGAPPPELDWVATLLGRIPDAARLPPCRVELDSDCFYLDAGGQRHKLGLGSSAALTVALLGALHRHAALPDATLAEMLAAHRAIQHGRGSGVDVAAALLGGALRFDLQDGKPHCRPWAFPPGLHWRCVYTGRPASTGAMLAALAAWRGTQPKAYARHLHDLATISARGVGTTGAAAFLECVREYQAALARLGEAAGIDIASREHRELAIRAAGCGCAYKSCGAGGGDVGVTFAVEESRLREFAAHATRAGFPVLELEADPKGLAVASTV